MRLQFPDQYPDKPPRVRFISEMFHPNVRAHRVTFVVRGHGTGQQSPRNVYALSRQGAEGPVRSEHGPLSTV